ncbi:MAG: oxygenase MpaB family protein [Mycobacteriaceae bacterium]
MTFVDDCGLFGPDSVSWRVQADPAAGIGGLSALFLQALHPLAMAGVFEHSSSDTDFWPRFQRTAQYVTTVNFGTTQEVDAAAARVRGLHSAVRGTDPVTGQAYSARNPKLVTWVHVTEVHSFLSAVQRAGLGLSGAEVDEYFREQVLVAQLLGATDVPASRSEVAEYLHEVRPQLVCTPTTRDGARLLLIPPMPWRVRLFTPARPAWAALAALGFCLMPRWARRAYRLPGLPTTDAGATVTLRALRLAALQIPERRRVGPMVLAARARADA